MKTIGLILIVAGLLVAGHNWISGDKVESVPVVEQAVQAEIVTFPDRVMKTGIIDYKEIEGVKWVGFREDRAGAESTWISCEVALSGSVTLPDPSIWYVETYCNE